MKIAKVLLCAAPILLGGCVTTGPNRPGNVHIVNAWERGIKFGLRCSDHRHSATWQREYLESGQGRSYWVDDCQRYEISVGTSHAEGDRDSVRYELYPDHRYKLVFDRSRQLFDVRKVEY